MEHSWKVATIAYAPATIKIKNNIYVGNVDVNAITVQALSHDVSEMMTSDMPTPIKSYPETIRNAYKTIKKKAGIELVKVLPEKI